MICMAFAYPGYEQYHHYDGHDLHQFDGGYGGGSEGGEADYGHHQIASQRIGHDEHAHEYHHEEDEHVDYYVSCLTNIHPNWIAFYGVILCGSLSLCCYEKKKLITRCASVVIRKYSCNNVDDQHYWVTHSDFYTRFGQ